MNQSNVFVMAGLFLIFTVAQGIGQSLTPGNYPQTEKKTTIEDYFGTKVDDPYRWLEDDKSKIVIGWGLDQNHFTEQYLSKIPYRNSIKKRLTQLWNFPKRSIPDRVGNNLFFTYNNGIQNQSVLFQQDIAADKVFPILDPNTLTADGTVALSGYKASKDGRYLAYMTSASGSDWNEIKVMDLKSKTTMTDVLKWVKFSGIAWLDNGFFYSRYDEPKDGQETSKRNEFHKIYFHKIGDEQSRDKLIYENKTAPMRNYGAELTEDGTILIIVETESTSGNALYYKDLTKNKSEVKPLVSGFDNDFEVVGKIGNSLLVRTNYLEPLYKLVLIDPKSPSPKDWTIFLPAKEPMVIESAVRLKDYVVVKYMINATNDLIYYDLTGRPVNTLDLPGIGTVGGMSGNEEKNDFYYSFTSFTYPNQIFNLDLKTGLSSSWFKSDVNIKPEEYETKQVFYPSKDGTNVPMFIVSKKGIALDGTNPTLLYGYGGFNISLTPSFSVSRLLFLENGGVYAIANIRGGGELGEDWHKAGTKEKKQNSFDDFIAAAQYLIDNGYTSSSKLAIQGGSNGGLLVGAVMTQRPELFKVALPAVGVLDMLRFHKFTIGWAWKSDYGSSEDKEGFDYLYKYSPLHNLKKGVNYPATLITTADHDDRVVPAHSFKFAATLQEMNGGNNPTLIRIDSKAGHGAGKPTTKAIDEATDVWAFTFFNLGMKFTSPLPEEKDGNNDIDDPNDPRRDEVPAYMTDPAMQKELPKKAPAPTPKPKK